MVVMITTVLGKYISLLYCVHVDVDGCMASIDIEMRRGFAPQQATHLHASPSVLERRQNLWTWGEWESIAVYYTLMYTYAVDIYMCISKLYVFVCAFQLFRTLPSGPRMVLGHVMTCMQSIMLYTCVDDAVCGRVCRSITASGCKHCGGRMPNGPMPSDRRATRGVMGILLSRARYRVCRSRNSEVLSSVRRCIAVVSCSKWLGG